MYGCGQKKVALIKKFEKLFPWMWCMIFLKPLFSCLKNIRLYFKMRHDLLPILFYLINHHHWTLSLSVTHTHTHTHITLTHTQTKKLHFQFHIFHFNLNVPESVFFWATIHVSFIDAIYSVNYCCTCSLPRAFFAEPKHGDTRTDCPPPPPPPPPPTMYISKSNQLQTYLTHLHFNIIIITYFQFQQWSAFCCCFTKYIAAGLLVLTQ